MGNSLTINLIDKLISIFFNYFLVLFLSFFSFEYFWFSPQTFSSLLFFLRDNFFFISFFFFLFTSSFIFLCLFVCFFLSFSASFPGCAVAFRCFCSRFIKVRMRILSFTFVYSHIVIRRNRRFSNFYINILQRTKMQMNTCINFAIVLEVTKAIIVLEYCNDDRCAVMYIYTYTYIYERVDMNI